jgi:NhaP-type Na+/H+ or K+/H+ antiporter
MVKNKRILIFFYLILIMGVPSGNIYAIAFLVIAVIIIISGVLGMMVGNKYSKIDKEKYPKISGSNKLLMAGGGGLIGVGVILIMFSIFYFYRSRSKESILCSSLFIPSLYFTIFLGLIVIAMGIVLVTSLANISKEDCTEFGDDYKQVLSASLMAIMSGLFLMFFCYLITPYKSIFDKSGLNCK